eukprot:1270569-Rhodomonas_salina.2
MSWGLAPEDDTRRKVVEQRGRGIGPEAGSRADMSDGALQDLNGNHVVQRCLQKLEPEHNQFIYEAVAENCVQVPPALPFAFLHVLGTTLVALLRWRRGGVQHARCLAASCCCSSLARASRVAFQTC